MKENFPAILRRTNHANGGGDLENSVTLFRLDDQGPIAHEGRSSRVTLIRFPSFHCTACNVLSGLQLRIGSRTPRPARNTHRADNPPREFSQPAIAMRFRSRFSDDPEIHSAHRPIGDIEYLHDVCLVRPTKVYRQAALARHHSKLDIALLEYCSAVPANRFGYAVYSTAQLKTMQEVVTLIVFALFSVACLKEPIPSIMASDLH